MESVRKSSNFFDYEAILTQCRNHWWWFVISILFARQSVLSMLTVSRLCLWSKQM